jgi:hypothetical protein
VGEVWWHIRFCQLNERHHHRADLVKNGPGHTMRRWSVMVLERTVQVKGTMHLAGRPADTEKRKKLGYPPALAVRSPNSKQAWLQQ